MGNNYSFQFENLQITNCGWAINKHHQYHLTIIDEIMRKIYYSNWKRKKIQPFVFIYLSRQSSISSYIQVFPQWKSFCLQPSKTISQKFQYPKILSFLFRQFILQKLMMAISKTKEEKKANFWMGFELMNIAEDGFKWPSDPPSYSFT